MNENDMRLTQEQYMSLIDGSFLPLVGDFGRIIRMKQCSSAERGLATQSPSEDITVVCSKNASFCGEHVDKKRADPGDFGDIRGIGGWMSYNQFAQVLEGTHKVAGLPEDARCCGFEIHEGDCQLRCCRFLKNKDECQLKFLIVSENYRLIRELRPVPKVPLELCQVYDSVG